GAIDFIKKPDKYKETSGEDFAKEFLKILEVVAQAGGHHFVGTHSLAHKERVAAKDSDNVNLRPSVKISGEKIVAIASSTGGPKALHSVIPLLPKNLNAPVILVQHMPAGFTKSLAERLDSLGQIHVKEAEEGDLLEKGTVYISPGGKHMKVGKSGSHVRIYFGDEPHREGVKPCANYMYESLIDTDYAEVCCVVLTGMGMDGTEGIKNLEKKKKLHIISQNEATCAVYGMPKAIAHTGLVNEVLPLDKIAAAITKEIGTR
ncbi:MAG: chemotaxis protein CheB, partial [Lachnospiraceae bacterium]|nr:chemotaxis protein CheB [Lachnospiraceae bacterium]